MACVCAPHQSSGTGGTTSAASSFFTSRLPTCGPLPWVRTTSTPSATRSATACIARGDRPLLRLDRRRAVGAGHGVAAEGDERAHLPPSSGESGSVGAPDARQHGRGLPKDARSAGTCRQGSAGAARAPGSAPAVRRAAASSGLLEQARPARARAPGRAGRRNASGSSAASGRSATTRSTMPLRSRSSERTPCACATSGARSTVRCTIDARALRRQRRQPGVLRRDDPVRRQQRQRSAAAALAEQHGTASAPAAATSSARQRAISPASPPSSASLDSAAPGGVDHGDERQVELGRRGASRGGPRAGRPGPSREVCCPRRSCPSTTHGAPPKRASASTSAGPVSPSPVPCSGVTSLAAVRSSRRTPGRSVAPRAGDRVPRRHVGRAARPAARPTSGSPSRGLVTTSRTSIATAAQVLGRHDGVDQPVLVEVLRQLHAGRERRRRTAPRRPAGRGSRRARRARRR